MTKVLGQSFPCQDQFAENRTSSKSNSQRPTRPKEIYRGAVELVGNTNRGQEEDESGKEGANKEEDDYNEPLQLAGHSRETHRHHQLRSVYQNNQQHNHHHHNHHAPSCLASKLVNVELSSVKPAARYQDQPQCLHLERWPQRHRPSCVLHKQPFMPSNRRLFKSLINQQHVQLSTSTGPLKAPVLDHYDRSASALERSFHHRHRQLRHPRLSADEKSRHLLAEQHQRLRHASGVVVYEKNNSNRDVYVDDQTNFRSLIHRSRALLTGVAQHGSTAVAAQSNDRRTTIRFISQLYFLLHLSAMISLLLHHKNLVSNERQVIQQPMQTTNELRQFQAPTRRSSLVATREEAVDDHHQHHPLSAQTTTSTFLVNNSNKTHILSPALPVPQMFKMGGDDGGQSVVGGGQKQPFRRIVRSSFGLAAADETRTLDLRSSDILVRIVGRLHAKCALQYFLCYLLLSSIAVLLLMWLFRICNVKWEQYVSCSHNVPNDRRCQRQPQVGTRRDCTPVLIGSISLGLIQLIVTGLEIADSVDWLTTTPGVARSLVGTNSGSELACHWPIFLPLLQFIFVALLMQFILAMVASNRGPIKKPVRHGLSASLQNIGLAHLLVTHILLWLMKLNSISLFQQSPALASFVVLPQPMTTTTSTTTTTTPSPSTTTPTMMTTERTTAITPSTGKPTSYANLDQSVERQEKVLLALRVAKEPPPPFQIGTRSSERSTVEAQRSNSTKTERDLRSVAERRPLSPVKTTAMAANQLVDEPKLKPPIARPAVPLLQPNVAFKSSLPKRMTAFRQNRPAQRLDLTLFNGHTSDAPIVQPPPVFGPAITKTPAIISTTPASATDTTVSSSEARSPGRSQRHKVRIIVNREQSIPSIDLRAVIPASAINRTDNDDLSYLDGETRDPSTEVQDADYPRTTERPFPSVNDDPPPKRSMTITTRKPPSSIQANASASNPKKVSNSNKTQATERPKVDGESEEFGENDEDQDENELDLDALLPPVPNYNETNSDQMNGEAARASMRIQTVRQARQMAPTNNKTQQSLLNEAAFAFNEAALSPVAHVTTQPSTTTSSSPKSSNITKPRAETASLPLGQSKHEAFLASYRHQEFRPNHQQHQQQQQPTFTDFLLPIVQQYHILVLTILFNMWLDNMQQCTTMDNQESLTRNSREREARPESDQLEHGRSVDLSSLSESSPTLSSASYLAEQFDSSSISQSSSTRNLVDALELAKRRRKANKLKGSYDRPRLRSAGEGAALSSRSSSEHPVALWTDATEGHERLHPGDDRPQEVSSSACSILFGLLVVSGSLIVILIGIDLLSLLVQCLIQLLSILFCFVGLYVVWRLEIGRCHQPSRRALGARNRTRANQSKRASQPRPEASQLGAPNGQSPISHKSSFHYLFLLTAYFCGISIALNLGQQHHVQRLFPIQVIQFIQRWLSTQSSSAVAAHGNLKLDSSPPFEDAFNASGQSQGAPMQMIAINCQLLFYSTLSLKGLVLIVQVTVQTVLIRSSWCWPSARAKLRQIYTFLMFTNLSLWALEICDQQQQMQLVKLGQQQHLSMLAGLDPQQHQHRSGVAQLGPDSELLSLDGFTRFAGSVVTLSHLYHGLVFMQH